MDWIKVTPERMQLDGEQMPFPGEMVFVTAEESDGIRHTICNCRYNPYKKRWEEYANASPEWWKEVGGTVTHWMPYPEPAED